MSGPTDRVVLVGAGLAGLSAALHLAGAGREVTILEREQVPGGRCGRLSLDGYEFDTGPAVLTMPDLAERAFAAVGERLADWVELRRLDPAYRAMFPDGSVLDVHSDVDAMAEEIRAVCGPAEAAGYRRFVDFTRRLYALEMRDFIDRNLDSPFGLLTPSLARLVAAGGFRRLAGKVAQYLSDPRTQRVFSFQAMYAGLSPYDALAIYAVIAYMDAISGVYFPVGGMHALPRALAGAAEKHGVSIRYAEEVARVEHEGRRASAVITTAGERIPADAVVLTADLPVAWKELLGRTPARHRLLRYSPSCVLLHLGSRTAYAKTSHHTIHFGRSWRGVFDEIIDQGRLMSDPSLLVTSATKTDPSLAPAGRHGYYVLAPTPHAGADIDWDDVGPRYRDELISTLENRGYVGFGDSIEVERMVTPKDWEAMGLASGAPFAAAHTFSQTGPFRPSNFPRAFDNVVFAGSGTQPGVGIPMVLVSGHLAARRITGETGE